MDFKTPYVNRPEVSPGLPLSAAPSMTMQQFAKEADINFLIDRYKKTGSYYSPLSVSGAPRVPLYEDISDLPDITALYNRVNDVVEFFGNLPSSVRAQFGNSVSAFVEFAQNPANYAKCVEMGVFERASGDSAGVDGPAPAPEAHKPSQGGEASAPTPLPSATPAAAL